MSSQQAIVVPPESSKQSSSGELLQTYPNKNTGLGELALKSTVLALLAFPLFLGGNTHIAISLFQVIVFSFACTTAILKLTAKKDARETRAGMSSSPCYKTAVWFAGCVILFGLIQAMPLPLGVVSALSPVTADLYQQAGATIASLSLERAATLRSLTFFFAISLVVAKLIALDHKNTRSSLHQTSRVKRSRTKNVIYEMAVNIDARVDVLQRAIIASGVVCSIIALAHLTTGTDGLFGVFGLERSGLSDQRAHWPFVNPNHLSVLLEMSIITALARLFRTLELSKIRAGYKVERTSYFSLLRNPDKLGPFVTQLLAIFVMTLAAILTFSRMGIALVALGTLSLWLFSGTRHRKNQNSLRRNTTSAKLRLLSKFQRPMIAALVMVMIAVFIGPAGREKLSQRIEYGLSFEHDQMRLDFIQASLETVKNYPIFGSGFGSWNLSVAPHVPASLSGWQLDYAHNDFVQILVEGGLVTIALILGFLMKIFALTRQAWRSELLPSNRVLLFGSSLALLLPLLHAFVDFPFHIPSLALAMGIVLVIHCRLIDGIIKKIPSSGKKHE